MNELFDVVKQACSVTQMICQENGWGVLTGWLFALILTIKYTWKACRISVPLAFNTLGKIKQKLIPLPIPDPDPSEVCSLILDILNNSDAVYDEINCKLITEGLELFITPKGNVSCIMCGDKADWDASFSLSIYEKELITELSRKVINNVRKREAEIRKSQTVKHLKKNSPMILGFTKDTKNTKV